MNSSKYAIPLYIHSLAFILTELQAKLCPVGCAFISQQREVKMRTALQCAKLLQVYVDKLVLRLTAESGSSLSDNQIRKH